MITRGEIWLVTLPNSTGREQDGRRPAVVIQDERYAGHSPLVLLIPLTSQLSTIRFAATVQIGPTPQNGLSLPSVALVFQVRALDRTRFIQRLGVLSTADLDSVLAELNRLTGQ